MFMIGRRMAHSEAWRQVAERRGGHAPIQASIFGVLGKMMAGYKMMNQNEHNACSSDSSSWLENHIPQLATLKDW